MTHKLYKGDEVCTADDRQDAAMVKAGWSRTKKPVVKAVVADAKPTRKITPKPKLV